MRFSGRGSLVAAALLVQALVLGVAGYVAYRMIQTGFAKRVEAQVIDLNRQLADTLASLLDEEYRAIEAEEGPSGVAFGSAGWERLQRLIEHDALTMLPAGGFACLIEEDTGQLLCHPEIRGRPELRSFSFKSVELREGIGEGARTPIVGEAGAGTQSGVTDFGLGTFDYLAHTPIAGSGLRLVVHQPVDELVRLGRESTRFIAWIAGAALAVVLGVTGGGLTLLLRRYDGVHEAMNRQLKENLRTAQRIQESTLPRCWPEAPGYAVAAWSRPAEETGGDTFDVIGLVPDGTGHRLVEEGEAPALALSLADATGHGVGPAIAVTQLQAMARVAWRAKAGLMDVVTLLSERLADGLPDGRFITAWFARLDHLGDEVEMFSAGQGPVLLVRAGGSVEAIESDSFPLGIEASLGGGSSRRVRMGTGDVLLVASDGIVEAQDASGAQFGSARLSALVSASRALDAGAIAARVRDAVEGFTGGVRGDDQTLLVVKRLVACKI